ncbi:putative virion structural protein [Salmonella phage SPFM15]|nr:putative virion structural protein [Salmonella phage SPFM5]VFR13821.1 putative virion structural protein [Salmonella phage SPFM15]
MQALYYISLFTNIALCSGVDTPETGESATGSQEYMNVTAILRGTPRSSIISEGRYVESGADLVIPWTEFDVQVPKELPDYDYDDDGTVEIPDRENGVETVKDFVYTDAELNPAYYLKRIDMRAVKTTDLDITEQRKQYAFRTRETIGARDYWSGMFSRVPLVLRTLDNDLSDIVDQSDVVADVVPVAKSPIAVPDGATRPHLGYMCVGNRGHDVQYPQKSTMNEFYKLMTSKKLSTVTLNAMRLTTALLTGAHSTGFAQENF